MLYKKSSPVQGAWTKASEVVSGTKAKIVSETKPLEGEYGMQDVAKVRFQGKEEATNTRLNKTTINALVDAFGEDSAKWQGNVLTAMTEKAIVGGKRVTILYLVPEGYELQETQEGYVDIVRKLPPIEVVNDPEVKETDLPF